MLGVKLKDKVRLTKIREKTRVTDVTYKVKRLKWKWTGHIMRSNKEKWTRNIVEWYP